MNSEKWTFFLFCFLNRAVVRQLLIHWLTSVPVKSGAGCLICVCHNGWRSTITELSFLAFQCTSVGSWFGSGVALTKTGTVTADVASQQVAVPHGPPGMTYVIVMTVFKMNLKELHREREIFNLLINSPNGSVLGVEPGWRQEPGPSSKSSFWIPTLNPPSWLLTRSLTASALEQLGHEHCRIMCNATMPDLWLPLSVSEWKLLQGPREMRILKWVKTCTISLNQTSHLEKKVSVTSQSCE